MHAPTSAEPGTAPQIGEDPRPAGLRNLWARIREAGPNPHHLFLVATGAIANVTFVTLGLYGAFGVHPAMAFVIAAWLILMQAILFEACRRNGLLLNSAGAGFYGLFVLFNVILAAGGITAFFGADTLGRSSFRQSVAQPLAAIHEVTRSTSEFAAAMAGVAAHSGEQHRLEVARGGTCTESARGSGPISRLREDDAAMFEAARRTMDRLSTRGREASAAIDAQIANYSAAQHAQVVAAISTALGQAQQLARDPGLAEARRNLEARAEQIRTGKPDRFDPSLLVACPRDSRLGQSIARALAIPAPAVPGDFEVPPVPSEATSVRGLFAVLAGQIMPGQQSDLGPWIASLLLAPLPDALFIFGLTLLRRARKAKRTLDEEIAADLGIAGADPQEAIGRALKVPRVQALYASHIFEQGWIFATDWLAIPVGDEVRRRLMLRTVRTGKAFDGGVCNGSDLPAGGEGFDPAARYHLFALKPGEWARLEADTVRAALASPEGPDGPQPASGTDALRENAA